MYDFPIVWEDVLRVQDELEKQIGYLNEQQNSLLDDFCELISFILDEKGLPETLRGKVKARFVKPQNPQP